MKVYPPALTNANPIKQCYHIWRRDCLETRIQFIAVGCLAKVCLISFFFARASRVSNRFQVIGTGDRRPLSQPHNTTVTIQNDILRLFQWTKNSHNAQRSQLIENPRHSKSRNSVSSHPNSLVAQDPSYRRTDDRAIDNPRWSSVLATLDLPGNLASADGLSQKP